MMMLKRVRMEDLGLEFQHLAEIIRAASDPMSELPFLVDAAKELCPAATGTLKASIRAEGRGPFQAALVAGGGGFINPITGRAIDYAGLVHEGTSWTMPRPFLLQAVIQERLHLAKMMIQRTAEAL